MKTISTYTFIAVLLVACISGCGNNRQNAQYNDQPPVVVDTAHNSRNSLDYEGTYTGSFPCADCPGIDIELTLSGNNYTLKTIYQGVRDGVQDTFEESGTYAWDNDGSIITLMNDEQESFLVGENVLYALDDEGQRITGELEDMYVLRKRM